MGGAGGTVQEHLARGPLVLDGATGTELERRGIGAALPLWSAQALLTAPEAVGAIHRDYVAAGADILVANTFRTNPRTLRAAGCIEQGPELNRRAVELARQAAAAAGRPVLVAASVGPVEDCYHPERLPPPAVLRAEHQQMMAWLAAAGPDLVWIETIGTVAEAGAAARAAAEAGLPLVVSLLTTESGALLGGEPLAAGVAAVEPSGPLAVGLNCVPPRGLTANLARLRALTGRPLAAYGHIGNAVPLRGWTYAQRLSPAEYAGHVREWLALGAAIVGGCCGTTPAHIRAVRAEVDRLSAGRRPGGGGSR